MSMRIHVIKHVPFEGPGRIVRWAEANGCDVTESLALTEEFPNPADVDLVCVMGGPMDADDHVRSPWLAAEKAWLRGVIDGGGRVLGVCLGAQILAEVLCGSVARNPQREIGWFKIALTDAGRTSRLFGSWPDEAVVGQWHGDTFELPAHISNAATSAAAANQAFEFDERVVGIQFHLEWDIDDLEGLAEQCADELAEGGEFVQSRAAIIDEAPARIGDADVLLGMLLDNLMAPVAR